MSALNLPIKFVAFLSALILVITSISNANAIQGGEKAVGVDFVVGIMVDLNENEAEICTGGLIAPRLIVTAGHCVIQNGIRFPFNDFSIYPPGANLEVPTDVKVEQILLPSGYQNNSEKAEPNDIAFIIVDRPLGDSTIEGIADKEMAEEIINSGSPIRVYGYGISGSGQDFPGHLKATLLEPIEQVYLEGFDGKENTFINYAQKVSGAICIGDSGGPAVAKYQGKLVLVTVTSASSGICNPSLGVDTNWGTIVGEFPELLKIALQSALNQLPQATTLQRPIKKSITCVKGKKIRKVTAVKPKCSKGYKLKK